MRIANRVKKLGIIFPIFAILGLGSCEEEGAGEKAGKKLDKAGQEIGKSVDDMKKSLETNQEPYFHTKALESLGPQSNEKGGSP